MATVTLVLPAVLREVAGAATMRVEAATIAGALEEAYRRVPALRGHLCDEDGSLRRHVLCFLNDQNTRQLGTLDVPLRDGDSISIVQAVSGGSLDADAPSRGQRHEPRGVQTRIRRLEILAGSNPRPPGRESTVLPAEPGRSGCTVGRRWAESKPMSARVHALGCVMTLAAMLAPTAAAVRTAAHLAVDAHHHEGAAATHDDLHDAATLLHGHGHDEATPAHSHDTTLILASGQASIPSLTVHPSVTVFVSSAFAADAAFLDRFDPSPPLRVPIILRI